MNFRLEFSGQDVRCAWLSGRAELIFQYNDFSKTFDKVSHSLFISKIQDWNWRKPSEVTAGKSTFDGFDSGTHCQKQF